MSSGGNKERGRRQKHSSCQNWNEVFSIKIISVVRQAKTQKHVIQSPVLPPLQLLITPHASTIPQSHPLSFGGQVTKQIRRRQRNQSQEGCALASWLHICTLESTPSDTIHNTTKAPFQI